MRLQLVVFLIFLVPILSLGEAHAEDQSRPVLQYPELQVTPLASARLQMEMQKEKTASWTQYLPFQVSALATIASGVVLISEDHPTFTSDKKDQANYAATTGIVVGAAWLGLSAYLNAGYHPYEDGYKEVAALPASNRKDTLIRERVAEESLDRAGTIGRRLTWLSVASNLLASGFIAASADAKGTKAVAAVSAVAAFAPVIFPTRWQYVAKQHELYKKRIYGPVVSSGLQLSDGKLVPMMLAQIQF